MENKEKEKEKEEPDLNKDLIINKTYKIQYKLGGGGFGKVYLVQNIKDGKNYALKVLLEKKNSAQNKTDFRNEITILKCLFKINHSYTLQLHEDGKFKTANKVERLYYVVDYAEKGDLLHYIVINRGLGEKFGKLLFKKILEGIQFCHNCNVCHLDIKVPNILLDDKFNPIIIDFGLSRLIKIKGEIKDCKGKIGTEQCMCPQMFEKGIKYFGIDADIFALGVLLFNIVLGTPCFYSVITERYKKIKDKNYELFWKHFIQADELSDEFKKLFVRMVAYNPEERPRIKEILLEDPWLNELNILIAKNPDEYKKLENEYISLMTKLEQKIKEMNQPEIEAPQENKVEEKQKTKGISFDESKKYFINLKPKKIKDKRNYKYCIKIKGYINENDFMNLLVNKIRNTYGTTWLLRIDDEKLKFQITFQREDNEEENEEEVEEDEDIRKDCIMKVKLYDSGINEYLLCFEKIQGELEEFYDNFLKIKEIIKNIFN